MRTKIVMTFIFLVAILCSLLFFAPVGMASSLVSGSFERSLGGGVAKEILNQYGGEYELPIQQRLWVEEVFRRLVECTERKDVEYNLTILNSSAPNAFALPGGYIFLTKGLLRILLNDENKLAAVLGHEIAHVEKRHGINAVFRQMGLTVLLEVGVIWLDLVSADVLRVGSVTLLQLLQLGWGREAEFEADILGQDMAVRAGFDSVGGVSALDSLAEQNKFDLPMKIFRTHPDIKNRRTRLEENMLSYWSKLHAVTENNALKRLELSRISHQNGRTDPNNRFNLKILSGKRGGLELHDLQSDEKTIWLQGFHVKSYNWSPKGKYLAVLGKLDSVSQIWLVDRYGYVIKRWVSSEKLGQINDMSWSLREDMLALDIFKDGKEEIVVTYVHTDVYIPITDDHGGNSSIWHDNYIYFFNNGRWYGRKMPETRAVVIPNPIPRVVERKRILSPTIIEEGNTIRLTSPSLILP